MNEDNNNFNNTVSNNMIGLKPMKVFLLSSLLVLTACGGSGGGGSDSSVPTVSSTSPGDNASNVARNSSITATFNKDILNTSVDATSLTLAESSANNTAGSVSFDGEKNVVSFTPNTPLSMLSTYTATLSTNIIDLSGNAALASNYNWSFTTADGAWGSAVLIENDTGDASDAQIAFDNNGNALAVWSQTDTIENSIWFNRYVQGAGWGNAELIETLKGEAFSPKIAIDDNGNALAVWRKFDGIRWNIMANNYTASSNSWGTQGLIETNNEGDASRPQIIFDRSGNALAVWPQSDGTRFNIWANRFDGTNWVGAERIEIDNSGDALFPQIAFDNNGNALVVWEQGDGVLGKNIWTNHFNGTSWGTAEKIEASTLSAFNPQIAFDNNGNALAVWQQAGDLRFNIWANRFDGTNWVGAELIETDDAGGSTFSPQIVYDNNGNALMVWRQLDSAGVSNIWANYFNGTEWSDAGPIETGAGNAFNPQIAFDNNNNALAVWEQFDSAGVLNIWANRFDGTNWLGTTLIEIDDVGNAFNSQIAVDSNGNALAVWQQNDGTRNNIMTNRFE